MNEEEVEDWFNDLLDEHMEHPWNQVGRCVWCGPCKIRLYQGTMPAEHEIYIPPRQPKVRTAADEMRARWGMD